MSEICCPIVAIMNNTSNTHFPVKTALKDQDGLIFFGS
jgi:hypothetical protein